MRFGIHTVEDYRESTHGSVPAFFERLIDRAVLAEELGYEGIWLTEHHFHWFGGVHSNPVPVLAAIAARTSTLRLGTAVTLLPYSNPLKLAEDISLLDNLSSGRVELGVGRGFFKVEYDGMGIPMSESRDRFAENLEVIRKAWTEDRFTFHGQFTNVDDLELVPKPVQQPHPPIWLAASITPESFELHGRLGLPLMVTPMIAPIERMQQLVKLYIDAYRQAGHTSEPSILGTFMTNVTDEVTPEYRDRMDQALRRFKAVTDGAARLGSGERDRKQFEHIENVEREVEWFTFDNLTANNQVLLGTPEHIAEVIDLWGKEIGLTYISIQPSWGGHSEDVVRSTIRRVAEDVMPAVGTVGDVASRPRPLRWLDLEHQRRDGRHGVTERQVVNEKEWVAVAHVDMHPMLAGDNGERALHEVVSELDTHGSISLSVIQHIDRPNHFEFIGRFESEDAYLDHLAAPSYLAFRSTIAPWIGVPYEDRWHAAVGGTTWPRAGGDDTIVLTQVEVQPRALERALDELDVVVAGQDASPAMKGQVRLQRRGRANNLEILSVWDSPEVFVEHLASVETIAARERLAPLLVAPIDDRIHVMFAGVWSEP